MPHTTCVQGGETPTTRPLAWWLITSITTVLQRRQNNVAAEESNQAYRVEVTSVSSNSGEGHKNTGHCTANRDRSRNSSNNTISTSLQAKALSRAEATTSTKQGLRERYFILASCDTKTW